MNRRHVLPQLGGTLRIYFLFAYYYALLNLCRFAECHYPRLVILDLVPDIAKGETMRDRAGLVLEPFVFLAAGPGITPIQVIATSRDFGEHPGMNVICGIPGSNDLVSTYGLAGCAGAGGGSLNRAKIDGSPR
jgi:hypothetical protein